MTSGSRAPAAGARRRRWRPVVRAASVLVLVATGVIGVVNGVLEMAGAISAAQRVVQGAVLLYGVSGLLAATGAWLGRAWGRRLVIPWGIGTTIAAGLAPIAYSEPEEGLLLGAIAGGIAAALLALGVWAALADAPRRVR